jgi:hypothetical protein
VLPEPPVLQWLFGSWLWLLREVRTHDHFAWTAEQLGGSDAGWRVTQAAIGLGHHVVSRCDDAPDDPEALDMTAELCAVYLGFGVFLANAATRVVRHPAVQLLGGHDEHSCALDEREISYALAIWAWMHEVPDDAVARELWPNPRAFYATATKDLRRRGREVAALRATAERFHDGPYR